MSTWEERMAQRAKTRRPNIPGRSVQQPVPPWQDPPADHGMCVECFEWRRYPPGQEHFGFCWWKICGGCDHKHHDDEVWLAAPLTSRRRRVIEVRHGCESQRPADTRRALDAPSIARF